MNYKIDHVEVLTLGTAAQTVKIRGLGCLIENNRANAVYFKECRDDGAAATAQSGWKPAPGEKTPIPLTAMELSLVAAGTDSDVRVLILDTE